ncbi:manganese catalase family protein [Aneurinibacillus tyrosinisolvens]|uniref:manganese catalase family protein n=1 Tax=Aneurinibacillus tyrosinisolvens TaxID=1443435 RepID=UPI00063EE3CD|nr:manganese catalase family protein [Aneurinibacillus tyrosinisolvens]
MFFHKKNLMYEVKVSQADPRFARILLEQFGGANGELAAAMQYFVQGLGSRDTKMRDMLMDIAAEEISHLEMVGTCIDMLINGHPNEEFYQTEIFDFVGGNGPNLMNSYGIKWTADYLKVSGETASDLHNNIAAEGRAKITYERLMTQTDDPSVLDMLKFLMTREVTHIQNFQEALYSLEEQMPGVMSGSPEFVKKYFNMSTGATDARGPWNEDGKFEYVEDPVPMGNNPAEEMKAKNE